MTLPPDRTRVAIEQMLAFGRSDTYIREHLGVTNATIDKVWLHLEEVNYDPDADPVVKKCPQGHAMTLDNLVHRSDGRRECLICKRKRSRDFGRQYRAAKNARKAS